MLLDFVIWTPSPEIFTLGAISVRWYGLLFASGFLIGQYILSHIFRSEGKPEEDVNTVTVYMVIATILGARLGHCLFYEPDYYLSNPLEMLKVWKGGLASHGATIGIITALYLYSRKAKGQSFLWILDRIVIVVALGGALIRMGNLMNSEIVGRPTDASQGFVFAYSAKDILKAELPQYIEEVNIVKGEGADVKAPDGITLTPIQIQVQFKKGIDRPQEEFIAKEVPFAIHNYNESNDHIRFLDEKPSIIYIEKDGVLMANVAAYGIPRHPSQLYEAISTFLLFVGLFMLWNKKKAATVEGTIFGWFVVILFSLRFVYEFYKENQVAFENELPLNMGQNLSIPMIVAGLVVLFLAYTGKTTSKPSA